MTVHPPTNSLHLIADIEGAQGLGDLPLIEAVLREAAAAARVMLIDIRLHHFGEGHGVTGVALLAESHISIHTWPEAALAAVDIFTCGPRSDPHAALALIEQRLGGHTVLHEEIRRAQG
ncbi:MAG: adenosylmethionine decarboxylase [Sphingomonadales bacterium]|nr:adenosylmethionine decarboxylase [Sphingomonadales bacterium]